MSIRKTEKTTSHRITVEGTGDPTVKDLHQILGTPGKLPGTATIDVLPHDPSPGQWSITIAWNEDDDDRPRAAPEPAPEGPSYGKRYQVVVPKKRLGETFPITEEFDNRLPAEYTRNGSSQVIVSSAGDDYVLTARVLPTDNKSCGNIAVDGPCILPEGHVGDWCMNSAGNSWIPKHKQQEGAHEETEQENTPECGTESPEGHVCVRPQGHHGDHADGYGGSCTEWSQEKPPTQECQARKWCFLDDGHTGPHLRVDGKRVLGDNPQA